ncbi:tyrosine-type recombinase/integrase [Furfurilactobacillus sp. WILCCON 0119]
MAKWTPLPKHPNIYSYETRKGTRYGIREHFTDVYSKRQEFNKSGFKTWREADVQLKLFEGRLARGELGPLSHSDITVAQYYKLLRDRKLKMGIWKTSTAKVSRNYFNQYFKDTLGDTPLEKVRRIDYQHLIDELGLRTGDEALSKTTIRTVNAIMQLIMNDAERNDIIQKNKLRGVQVLGGEEPRSQTLEKADYETYMNTAKKVLNRYQFDMLYLLTLGERRSEILGLRKESFDFLRDDLHGDVCKITFDRGRTPDEPNGTTLKTKSAYRSIYVFGDIVDMIRYVIQESEGIRRRHNLSINDSDYIYLNEDTGKPVHPTYPNRMLKKVSAACGIDVHPHLLRHYFATEASGANLPNMDVMHWLGHKHLQMTEEYTRGTKEGMLRVMKGMSGG